MVGSGNERSQSHSLGKITFQYVDQAKSPPHNTIVTPIEQVVNETIMKK
jgi:hypothetical protein